MSSTKEQTGYPSIDRPWLKYYSREAIEGKLPECSIYEYMYENNKDYPSDIAINLYFLFFSHSNHILRATGVSGRSFLQPYMNP